MTETKRQNKDLSPPRAYRGKCRSRPDAAFVRDLSASKRRRIRPATASLVRAGSACRARGRLACTAGAGCRPRADGRARRPRESRRHVRLGHPRQRPHGRSDAGSRRQLASRLALPGPRGARAVPATPGRSGGTHGEMSVPIASESRRDAVVAANLLERAAAPIYARTRPSRGRPGPGT